MKILLLSLNHTPEKTGIGKYQGEMAAWLSARGHQVTAVVTPPYYPEWRVSPPYSPWRYKTEVIEGVNVIRVPLYVPQKPTGLKRLLHLASFTITSAPVVLWHALRNKPDVILMTAPPLMASPVALLAAKLCGARVYMHVHDFEVDAAFQLGLLRTPFLYALALRLERLALRAFSGVSTISPNMRAKLLKKGVPVNQTHLVPNWANTDMFAREQDTSLWIKRFKQNPKKVLAVYSGNLGRKQGLETIVEAARVLQERCPNLHFVISGDGAGREDMQERAKGLSNIDFLPVQPMDDFLALMKASDIHLLPQKANAADLVMPSKLGNILASGKPVVIGAAQGTQLFDAIQGCGIACPPDDVSSFADALMKLAGDPSLRERMGRMAKVNAEKNWSKQCLLEGMEAMLFEACAVS